MGIHSTLIIVYKDKQPTFGYHSVAPGKKLEPYRQFYDAGKGFYEKQMPGDWQHFNFEMPKSCNSNPKNLFMGGFSYLREDSYDPFGLYGGFANYTWMLDHNWGAGVDLGVNTGGQT